MRDEMKSQGYSKEDEYFHRKDVELIRKLREKAEAQKAKAKAAHARNEYWMRCPKCGSSLTEENYGSVLIDRCTSKECGGVFLDEGELEILLRAKRSLISRVFGR